MKREYSEDKIIVLGYSIGSGLASKVASDNNPKLLILQAPYYSLTDMMRNSFPFLPTFILKYKFETNEHLKACEMPIVIFHGDRDEVIDYGSSLKLEAMFKDKVKLITLHGQRHNGITENADYAIIVSEILESRRNSIIHY